MDSFKELFHKVRSVTASCRMNKDEISDFETLNKEYNALTGSRTIHSICSKKTLLNKVETYIDAKDSEHNQ